MIHCQAESIFYSLDHDVYLNNNILKWNIYSDCQCAGVNLNNDIQSCGGMLYRLPPRSLYRIPPRSLYRIPPRSLY